MRIFLSPRGKIILFFTAALFLSMLAWGSWKHFLAWNDLRNAIHIAVAAPMKGPDAALGKSAVQGIGILLDRINSGGGIRGRKIVLDVFDDENKESAAEKKALEIAEKSQALAVIGHTRSSNSIAAGKIYKKYGIPAITPGSSNVNVTKDNPWYFRNIFNDNQQGRFLAYYAKKILGYDTVSIIRENKDYGAYLGQIFAETSQELGSTVRYSREFKAGEMHSETLLRQITEELKEKKDAGLIFLATQAEEGILLVRMLRESGIQSAFLGPQTYSSAQFSEGMASLTQSVSNPGYYTDTLYVTTPLIFDTANETAQLFKAEYRKKYKDDPDWRAAFSYDSALMITEAIRKTGIEGKKNEREQDRKKIRDWLEGRQRPEDALAGVTGLNYFDTHRDSPKPLSIGIYKGGEIVSAPVQLQPAQVSEQSTMSENKAEIVIDGKEMYRTDVVYTGVEINSVKQTDLEKSETDLDFHLWFRYRTGGTPWEITFLNAAGEIDPAKALVRQENGGMTYEMYHIRNRFKTDFLPSWKIFGEHVAGISFRHRSLGRNRMIYVTDVVGMGLMEKGSLPARMGNFHVSSTDPGWIIRDRLFFQDTVAVHALGNPEYISYKQNSIDYSRFNAFVRIKKNEISLRGLIFSLEDMFSSEVIEYSIISLTIMLVFLIVLQFSDRMRNISKIQWFLRSVLVLSLMVLSELRIVDFLIPRIQPYHLELTVIFFDMLWWAIPAILLIRALNPFLWFPLERHTGRAVPRLMRNMTMFVIFMGAGFGIIAFVFHQKLTGLLATSGLLAMIIGLAIQMNISNIFSGIVVNLERPFRIGDWIKIGDAPEGVVTDITWRTTRILTRSNVLLGFPNSLAAESRFENYSHPSPEVSELIYFHTDPLYSSAYVEKILKDAAFSVKDGIACGSVPIARFSGIEEWAARYTLSFTIPNYGDKFRIRNLVWSRIMVHMKYAGIVPAIRDRGWYQYSNLRDFSKGIKEPSRILNEINSFHILPEDFKASLCPQMRRHNLAAGKMVVREGDEGYSLFVITEGAVSISVSKKDGSSAEVARLGAGNFFGEISLLSGAVRNATVIALTDIELFEIPGADIDPLLKVRDDFHTLIEDISSQRKNITEDVKFCLADQNELAIGMKPGILERLKRFLK